MKDSLQYRSCNTRYPKQFKQRVQWTQLNTMCGLLGSLDLCNGIAFSNTPIYASTNHGIIRCPGNTAGQLTSWSKPPLQPFPTYPATSIVNSGDLVYYLIPGVGVITIPKRYHFSNIK
ncbi:MAG: hypothetical protein IPJ31_12985 [Bacteroidetes bacterium]|nr:hypothetical protein [Bacteroidota bacterium]